MTYKSQLINSLCYPEKIDRAIRSLFVVGCGLPYTPTAYYYTSHIPYHTIRKQHRAYIRIKKLHCIFDTETVKNHIKMEGNNLHNPSRMWTQAPPAAFPSWQNNMYFQYQTHVNHGNPIGFAPTPPSRNWHELYGRLFQFMNQTGHCNVPSEYIPDRELGIWVSLQRKHKSQLLPHFVSLLDQIGFQWDGNNADGTWRAMYEKLASFKTDFGHCIVPQNYDPVLASWIEDQRNAKQSKLLPHCISLLDQIGFQWDGNTTNGTWGAMYKSLASFKTHFGHCIVPQNYDSVLASWIEDQRSDKQLCIMPLRQIEALNELGFEWDAERAETLDLNAPASMPWPTSMNDDLEAYLQDRKTDGEHSVVPSKHNSDPELIKWVNYMQKYSHPKYRKMLLVRERDQQLLNGTKKLEKPKNESKNNEIKCEGMKPQDSNNGATKKRISTPEKTISGNKRCKHEKEIDLSKGSASIPNSSEDNPVSAGKSERKDCPIKTTNKVEDDWYRMFKIYKVYQKGWKKGEQYPMHHNLREWVNNQYTGKPNLSEEQKELLKGASYIFFQKFVKPSSDSDMFLSGKRRGTISVDNRRWTGMYKTYIAYEKAQSEGKYYPMHVSLEKWVDDQYKGLEKLSPERRIRLEDAGFDFSGQRPPHHVLQPRMDPMINIYGAMHWNRFPKHGPSIHSIHQFPFPQHPPWQLYQSPNPHFAMDASKQVYRNCRNHQSSDTATNDDESKDLKFHQPTKDADHVDHWVIKRTQPSKDIDNVATSNVNEQQSKGAERVGSSDEDDFGETDHMSDPENWI